MNEGQEIEIIIWCGHCGHTHHQGERYTFFSQALKDYDDIPCPECGQIKWILTARLREREARRKEQH